MRNFEEGFSQVDPLEQAFLKLVFDSSAVITLLADEGASEFIERIVDEGPHAIPLLEGQQSIPPETLIVIAVCSAIQRIQGEMRDETIYEAARRHRDFAADARHLREKPPWGWWYESSRAWSTAELIVSLFGLEGHLDRVHQLVETWQKLT